MALQPPHLAHCKAIHHRSRVKSRTVLRQPCRQPQQLRMSLRARCRPQHTSSYTVPPTRVEARCGVTPCTAGHGRCTQPCTHRWRSTPSPACGSGGSTLHAITHPITSVYSVFACLGAQRRPPVVADDRACHGHEGQPWLQRSPPQRVADRRRPAAASDEAISYTSWYVAPTVQSATMRLACENAPTC